ncbi:MAG: MerR family transcriptional regulator [Candidatus Fermentibacter sp.]|nr:MerR family transcriptional regulator [Candidatus Fermentibacter sp.]
MKDGTGSERFSIAELAALAGVSRRTVRFYVQTRLIPPPHGAGRGSYYTRNHLEAILHERARQAGPAHPRVPAGPVSAGGAFHSETVTIIRLAGGYSLLVGNGQAAPSSSVLERLSETLNDPGGSASGKRREGGDEEEG